MDVVKNRIAVEDVHLLADLRADDGLYVTVRTAGSLGGMVDEDCEVWAPDGRLLLQGRQFRFVQG